MQLIKFKNKQANKIIIKIKQMYSRKIKYNPRLKSLEY